MNNKNHKTEPQIADVTAPELVISSRPIMNRDMAEDTGKGDEDRSEPLSPTPKRTVIVPVETDNTSKPEDAEASSPDTQDKQTKPEDDRISNQDANPTPPASTTSDPVSDATKPEVKPDTPDNTEENDSEETSAKPSLETQKVIEAATKREKELQGVIDSGKYYVPVNTVAHKRSIKVSILLTFLVIILGIALIDLMLDSGAIFLIQRIPHTHLLSTNN